MTLVCTKFGFLKQPGSNVCTCVSFHTGANCSISGAVLLSDEVHVFNILFMLVNCFVILSRPVSAEAVLDDLVKEQRMPVQKGVQQGQARQREGMPLLTVRGAGE